MWSLWEPYEAGPIISVVINTNKEILKGKLTCPQLYGYYLVKTGYSLKAILFNFLLLENLNT